ncbi:MAG: hypothetical protein LBQ30_06940 [Treponema sp.]|nr:hypothetical protein [Treponema sp.]
MGQKELLRGKVMELVKRGQMTIWAAAKELNVNYRQGRREIQGSSTGMREQAVRAYRGRYSDFGPTFAAEQREEEKGIRISEDTLRRWLLAEGLWEGKQRRRAYRSRRER